MTDDPYDLAAEIATLACRASVEAVRCEYRSRSSESQHLMGLVRTGVAAIKSGEVRRMQCQVEILRKTVTA